MIRELTSHLNLDEFNDPEFTVTIEGVRYPARVRSLHDLEELSRKESEIAKRHGSLEKTEAIVETLSLVFGIEPETLRGIHLQKLAVLYNTFRTWMARCWTATTEDLENFRKAGKAAH